MNVSPSEISIDCIYFPVCLYEKPPFSRFFSLLLSLFNQKCYELSQGPGIEPKDACEIGILLFKT